MALPIRKSKNAYTLDCHDACYSSAALERLGREQPGLLAKASKRSGAHTRLFLNVDSLRDALETANYLLYMTR